MKIKFLRKEIMTTLRRDLRKKFEELVLESSLYYGASARWEEYDLMSEEACKKEAIEFADKLADAAIELTQKPAFDVSRAGLDWTVALGGEVAQESIDNAILAKEAQDAFEVAFSFNPPWHSNKDWTDFADFVVKIYKQDKASRTKPGNVWSDYCLWREQDSGGRFGKAMTNVGIRKNPRAFMDTAIPTFLAASVMSQKPTQTSFMETDENGLPISR